MTFAEMISSGILKLGVEFSRIQDSNRTSTFMIMKGGAIRGVHGAKKHFTPSLEYLSSDDFQYREPECFNWLRTIENLTIPDGFFSPPVVAEKKPSRDEIAAMAIQGMTANASLFSFPIRAGSSSGDVAHRAVTLAYSLADKLIKRGDQETSVTHASQKETSPFTLNGFKIGWTGLVSYPAVAGFPVEIGNNFSIIVENEKEYSIKNFNLENLEELLKRKVIEWPVEILPVAEDIAIICDQRIPEEWYSRVVT